MTVAEIITAIIAGLSLLLSTLSLILHYIFQRPRLKIEMVDVLPNPAEGIPERYLRVVMMNHGEKLVVVTMVEIRTRGMRIAGNSTVFHQMFMAINAPSGPRNEIQPMKQFTVNFGIGELRDGALHAGLKANRKYKLTAVITDAIGKKHRANLRSFLIPE